MSIKETYNVQKKLLVEDIKSAIRKFEANTGCLVLSLNSEDFLHLEHMKVESVTRSIIVKTNIESD